MGREFVRELSVALGFVGIAMMALQFVVTARISTITLPYGSDVVYHFHHYMSLVVLGVWLAHPVILVVKSGTNPRSMAIQVLNVAWSTSSKLSPK